MPLETLISLSPISHLSQLSSTAQPSRISLQSSASIMSGEDSVMGSCDSAPMLEDDDDFSTYRPCQGGAKEKRGATYDNGEENSKRKTRSWVWDHFTRESDNYDKCSCNYCGKGLTCPTSSGTSNMINHLGRCKQFKALKSSSIPQTKSNPHADELLGEVGKKELMEACYEMLVLGGLPLSFLDSVGWRQFCETVQLHMPDSRGTAYRGIYEMFVKKKAAIKKTLEDNNQRLSLTTDIWEAPDTGSSYMAITAHYIDDGWHLKKLIIGFKYMDDHEGETICNILTECLAEWGINKVFCITVDNVTANSSAMVKFRERFMQLGSDSLVLNGEYLHIRCVTDILNSVVKEGLQKVDNNIAAIRNGVQFVRSSTNQIKSFDLLVEKCKIPRGSLYMDDKTSWNSTYLMLITALKFRLAFNKMEEEDKSYNEFFLEVEGEKRVGPPTDVDWESVEALSKLLVLFYNSTLVLSASISIFSHKCYNELATVVRNLQSYSKSSNVSLQNKASAMLGKFDKYWNPFGDMNKLLIVASVFDPSKKMKFAQLCFEKLYGKDSVEANHLNNSVMEILKKLFEEYRGFLKETGQAGESGTPSNSQSQMQSSQSQKQVDRMGLESFIGHESMDCLYEIFVEEVRLQESSDELELYLKANVEDPNLMLTENDVLSWWKRNSLKLPVLSLIARDILAMQVSYVASESAFSTIGRILDPSKSGLIHFMLEVSICVEQWLKSEFGIDNNGIMSPQQILSDIEFEDDLMREFGL